MSFSARPSQAVIMCFLDLRRTAIAGFASRTYRPRGIAVVMVLGLLAITIAISYATLRGQGTTIQLARNNSRSLDARGRLNQASPRPCGK